MPAIVDATAPRRVWRQIAREQISRFAEVQLVCPSEICGSRERAARWKLDRVPWPQREVVRAAAGPDIVLDYEPSLNPDLTIYTDVQTPWTAIHEVLGLVRRLRLSAAGTGRRAGDADDIGTEGSESAR